jgi:copper(I)-binding protein
MLSAALGAAFLIAGSFGAMPARGAAFELGDLAIEQPWARASAGPARNSAAFMVIRNAGPADRLVAAAGEVAERVELHTHLRDGDVMKMRQVEAVDIPAESMARLQPGGYHVMLIGLREPLKEGDSFPLTLTFANAGKLRIEVDVRAIGSMGPGDGMGHGALGHDGMMQSN